MKNVKLKAFVAFLSILVLGMFLVACGNDEPEVADEPEVTEAPPADEEPEPEPEDDGDDLDPVTITVGWWGGQARHDITIEAIELFMELYPHITVTEEFHGWDDYWTMLNTAAVGNSLPDVIEMDITRISEFHDNGLIIGLNDFINRGVIDMSNVDMAAYQAMLNIDGEYRGISLGANGFAMVYNTELAEELGFVFTPELTWNEFGDFLREAGADREDFYGFGFGAEYEIFTIFTRDSGYSVYGDGELAVPREVLVDFFEMLDEWNRDEIIMTHVREDGMTEGQNALHHEILLAQMFASNQIVWQQGEVDAELGLALLPRVEGGRGGNWIRSSMQFAISAQSGTAEQEAAALFIDFFTNNLEANEILRAERGAPISSVVMAHLRDMVDPVVVKTFDILPIMAANASPADPLPPAEQAAVRTAFFYAVEAVRHGDFTPEEAADHVIAGAEDAFSW